MWHHRSYSTKLVSYTWNLKFSSVSKNSMGKMYCFTYVCFKNHQEGIHITSAMVLFTLKVLGGIPQNRERHFHVAVHILVSCSSFIIAKLCILLFLMQGYIFFCCCQASQSFTRWGHPNFPALSVLFCTIGPQLFRMVRSSMWKNCSFNHLKVSWLIR